MPGGHVAGGPHTTLMGPQLAPRGASWGLGLDWAPLHIQKAHLAAGGLACIPRKFAAAATQAGKKSMGNPLSIAGSLVLLATHWLRTWRVSCKNQQAEGRSVKIYRLWPVRTFQGSFFYHYAGKCNPVWGLRCRRINFPVRFNVSSPSFSVHNARTGPETHPNASNNQRISRTTKWWASSLHQAHAEALPSMHIRNGGAPKISARLQNFHSWYWTRHEMSDFSRQKWRGPKRPPSLFFP